MRHFVADEAEETATFIERFNKFFDILNVTNNKECYQKRKYDKLPYRWDKDQRLEWLQSIFLPWLDDWEREAKARKELKAEERNKLILSSETLTGIRITALSFIDLIRYIFIIPGVKSFLSERISQDPLEKFFGRQRQRGHSNENPTAKEFLSNNQALRVVSSIRIDTSKGNTRGRNEESITVTSNGLLPKRRKCTTSTVTSTPAVNGTLHCAQYTPSLIGTVAESLTNNIFNLPSLEARTAKENAEALQKWMSVNQQAAQPYENYLLFFFKIWTSAPPSNHSVREQIWQRFTLFLSSTEYSRSWHNLYKSANVTMNSPILSCYITYKFFIEFWKGKYQLPAPSQHKYL